MQKMLTTFFLHFFLKNKAFRVTMDTILVERPVFTKKKFDVEFAIKKQPKKKSIGKKICQVLSNISLVNILGIFTIIDLIFKYDHKKNLLADVLSGITGLKPKTFVFKN